MILPSDTAIRVSNLSKLFRIYNRPADLFLEAISGKPRHKPFWALQNISFGIKRGEVVGIMGRNGAGKSTLLKIITGTLDRTSGELDINGRISSILELGTGFNREYSGRENIYLGGLMVGLSHQEITTKMDWIIEFSELKDFIDQPFKTYSTGMQVRLTFATAVCVDPDILIVDEALSVGDARFQRKSFSKIQEFRNAGHTILLVSHDINTIATFCDRAILMENGKIYDQGEPERISKVYYKMILENETRATHLLEDESHIAPNQNLQENTIRQAIKATALKKIGINDSKREDAPHAHRMGTGQAEILDYGISNQDGERVERLVSGENYTLFFKVVFYEDLENAEAGFLIRNVKGVDLFGIGTLENQMSIVAPRRGDIVEMNLNVNMYLTNGVYFVTYALGDKAVDGADVQYDLLYDAFQFEVRNLPGIFTTSVVNLQANLTCQKIG